MLTIKLSKNFVRDYLSQFNIYYSHSRQTCSEEDWRFSTLGGGGRSTGPSSIWALAVGAGLDRRFSELTDPLDSLTDEDRLESLSTTEDSSSVNESNKRAMSTFHQQVTKPELNEHWQRKNYQWYGKFKGQWTDRLSQTERFVSEKWSLASHALS